jgi:hypothetical protein
MIAEKKASSDNDRFVEPDVFGPSTIGGWGDSEGAGVYAEAKIQELAKRKMRSGQPELATGNGDCSRKSKAFRSEMAARWILEAIVCEVCQAVRNLPQPPSRWIYKNVDHRIKLVTQRYSDSLH